MTNSPFYSGNMMHNLDAETSVVQKQLTQEELAWEKYGHEKAAWEKVTVAQASESPEWLRSPCSDSAPTALPSDRGLHVRPDMAADAPQAREEPSLPIAVFPDAASPTSSPLNEPDSRSTEQSHEKPPSTPLICGLRRRTFGLVAIILFILSTGAVIGGAVGGTFANRKQDQDRPPLPTGSSNPSEIFTPASPTPVSSPTSTNSPRNNFLLQIWSLPAFGGRTQMFSSPGSFRTAFLARSYIWRPGQYDQDTLSVCSVALCSGSVQLGWRGSGSRDQPGYPQNKTWGVDNVVFECRTTFSEPLCPGPAALETFGTVPVLESWTGSLTLSVSTSGNASGTVTTTQEGKEPARTESTISATTPST